MDHRVCGGRAGADDSGAFRHHDALLPKAVRGLLSCCHLALSGLYLLYCGQDPAQVYQFYSYDYIWNKGIGYLQYAPTIAGYVTIVVVNVICGVLGTISLLHYTQDSFLSDQEEMALERKFDIARTGASVFVHSIKNQLLANRILEKRMLAGAGQAGRPT